MVNFDKIVLKKVRIRLQIYGIYKIYHFLNKTKLKSVPTILDWHGNHNFLLHFFFCVVYYFIIRVSLLFFCYINM